jgi:hypothetical protein
LNIIGSITREHNDSLIRQAQQCLQLVVTDFLSTIPICYLGILIKVVAKFGFQEQDLNIALSAIGLLWNMTDYLFRMKEQEHQLKNVNDYLDANEIYDNLTAIEELWMILYRKLSELTIDHVPRAIAQSWCVEYFNLASSLSPLRSSGTILLHGFKRTRTNAAATVVQICWSTRYSHASFSRHTRETMGRDLRDDLGRRHTNGEDEKRVSRQTWSVSKLFNRMNIHC